MTSNLENHIFQSQQIPQSVIVLAKIMPELEPKALNAILKLVLDTIRNKPLPSKAIENLSKKIGLVENADHLFCGLMMLLQAILRLPQEGFNELHLKQGLKELKFTEECSNEFMHVFSENKSDLINNRYRFGDEYFLKIENFNWRVDITISSNYLAKSLDTVIIFNIKFKNGETKSFEVSIAKFHQLRFYVSSMLKEMEFIEKKNVFKT